MLFVKKVSTLDFFFVKYSRMRVTTQTIYPLLLFSSGYKNSEYSMYYKKEAQPTP